MIEIRMEETRNRSAAYDGEKEVGCCEFEPRAGEWHIYHTETDPAYGGQGIARRLVLAVAESAKGEALKLSSSCSYATKVLGL